MTKSQMHSYVSTSAKLALGLFLAGNICLSTAWSDTNCYDGYCDGPSPSSADTNWTNTRTGGCGIMPRGLVGSPSPAVVPVARLSPEQAYRVSQIVRGCLIVTKTDQNALGVHIAQAQVRPGCQNYIQYSERGTIGYGALNLGNEVLQMRIKTKDGMDWDENAVDFAVNGKIIATYRRTDDSIENGLALLKILFN